MNLPGGTRAVRRAGAWFAAGVAVLALAACGGSRTVSGTDLVVTGTGPSGTLAGGDTATFSMVVRNAGPGEARDVRIVNNVGNQLALASITCEASGGATCPATPSVSMVVPTMPGGGRLVFTVTAGLVPTAAGTLSNTLTASIDDEINRNDNSATVTFEAVTPQSNLVVAGTGPAAPVPAGSEALFTMTVRNDGPDEARNLRIVDTPGSNLTLTGVTCQASPGAACPSVLGISMSLDALPVGATLTFGVATRVNVGVNGAITNTLQVSSDFDPERADNTAVAVAAASAVNVGVTASGPGVVVPGGGRTSLSFTVSNEGPAAAADVDLTVSLGSNLTLAGTIDCVAAGGAICPAATALAMRAPSVPAGATLGFVVPVTVAAGASGTQLAGFAVAAAGDSRPGDNNASATVEAVSTNLGVSQAGPGSVGAGTSAVYTAVVANPGPGTATNLVFTWSPAAPFALAGTSVACNGTGGATCPATLGASMALASLGPGRSLVFTLTVPVPAEARGAVASTFSVAADGDPDASNNASSVTTQAVDAKNGVYRVYATDGRAYELTIDFDARQYTMAGNGGSATLAFTTDPGGDHVVGGASRLRTAEDIVVGGHDFGAGVVPFVAARRFETSLPAITGAFNLATRNVAGDGTGATTRAGTARVTGNVLQVCQDDFEVAQPQSCGVAALRSYTLSVSGDVFTGVDTVAGGAPLVFRVARSGSADILLSAGGSTSGVVGDTSLQWRIGLPESAGLAGGVVFGPGLLGTAAGGTPDWLRIELTRSTYAALGLVAATVDDTAGLERPDNASPVSMLTGEPVPRLGAAPVWVMQAVPLVVVVGSQLATGPDARGLIQIGLP